MDNVSRRTILGRAQFMSKYVSLVVFFEFALLYFSFIGGDLFMKYNIPLALLAAIRTLAERVNTEFTVMPMSLLCSHFCKDLPSASSDRAIRRPGETPIDS